LKPSRWRRLVVAWASILGLASLSFLSGAAVLYFDLPPAHFLQQGFEGAQAWYERQSASAPASPGEVPRVTVGKVDIPNQAFDGFTLYGTDSGSEAVLIDMRGEVVHRWKASFSQVWPKPRHVKSPVDDASISFFSCYLCPNGDVLAVFQARGDTPYGYGLVKLDKDSKLLWRYDDAHGNVHHDVDVGDDGTIYALTQQIVSEVPQGLEFLPTPCLIDYLVMLSPEGRQLKTIPILEAFRDSPYAPLLGLLAKPPRFGSPLMVQAGGPTVDPKGDVLHTNCVNVLSRKLAPMFPMFKEGQVLISVRQMDALAVVDTDSRSIVWAVRGPWQAQHDPRFLDNGHLLLFDNLGAARGSRVLEYDPQTQGIPWSYSGETGSSFFNAERGMCQRLPNGNTLIVDSYHGELLEVTQAKKLVWSCDTHVHLPFARRYGPDELEFLKGNRRPRP
jgi:hypothetical protein